MKIEVGYNAVAFDGTEFRSDDKNEAEHQCKEYENRLLSVMCSDLRGHVLIVFDNHDLMRIENGTPLHKMIGDYNEFYVRVLDTAGVDLVSKYFKFIDASGDARIEQSSQVFTETMVDKTYRYTWYEGYNYYSRDSLSREEFAQWLQSEITWFQELACKCKDTVDGGGIPTTIYHIHKDNTITEVS